MSDHIILKTRFDAAIRIFLIMITYLLPIPSKGYLFLGDFLCRSRKKPNYAFIKMIYIASSSSWSGDSPLIRASRMGFEDMVWGFIELAKHNTNVHTGETGEFQNFLWRRNKKGVTAFDVAVDNKYFHVAELLLANAPLEFLISERNHKGKLIISMLPDELIISILEAAKKAKEGLPTSASILIDDNHQGDHEHHDGRSQMDPQISIVDEQPESKVYDDIEMDINSYPKSQRSETRMSLDKLDIGKRELTPNNSTILHLVSTFGDIKYVNDILEKHPSLVYYRNSEGETPAYVAAREGHADILAVMINYLKKRNASILSFLIRDKDNHNVLHIAIQNHHAGVIFLLINELPELANHINCSKVSPIYLAAERGYAHILQLMLETSEEKSYEGPTGKTALHAAVISESTECIKLLLSTNPGLLQKEDGYGWTPLRYAVDRNKSLATEILLKEDPSPGYQIIKEDKITTSLIHIAVSQGHYETVKALLSEAPGCSDITDSNGRNILHVAIQNKKTKIIELIFGHEFLAYLINQQDYDGNTPIHLMASEPEMMETSELEMKETIFDSRIDISALNKKNLTPLDVASSNEMRDRLLQAVGGGSIDNISSTEDKNKDVGALLKQVQGLVVVTALVATATFAAGFTVPGGYDPNDGSKQGSPILLKKAAFQVFLFSDTTAFCSSLVALNLYVLLLFCRSGYDRFAKLRQKMTIPLLQLFLMYTGVGIFSMGIVLASGVIAVLPSHHGMAYALLVATIYGSTPFLTVFMVLVLRW